MPVNSGPDPSPRGVPTAAGVPPEPAGPWGAARRAHRPVFLLFLVVLAAGSVLLGLRIDWSSTGGWAEALFLLLGSATSLVSLARRLPLQNVLAAAALIGSITGLIEVVSVFTSIPFGPRIYTDRLGPRCFNELPWTVPLIWVVVLLNARGVARLIMRPWRKTTFYGFWVIGLACLLAVLFDVDLEPFATQVRRYWLWHAPRAVPGWYSAPWVNSLAWFVTALATLGFTTPWLLNKHPVKQPTDYHPLVLWILVNLFFATGCAWRGMWPAVGVNLIANACVTFYAIRGARW